MLKHATVQAKPFGTRSEKLAGVLKDHSVVKKEHTAQVDKSRGRRGDEMKKYELVAQSGDPDSVVRPIGGLVGAATLAYNRHHGLVLRPDDVWQAIATQFSFYVTGNAEALRSRFVKHEGKKELTVSGGGSLRTTDYGALSKAMSDEIARNLKDPSVTAWLTPDFTTTTETDRVAAAVTVMSTVKEYFSFTFCLMCGLPSVELLGTVEDWEKLLAKTRRLSEFDVDGHVRTWQAMLEPIIDEMVATKQGKDNMDWWQRIAHYKGGGSGPTYLSGWITAFAVFNEKGKWQGGSTIDTSDLPPTVVTCPVKVDDNGIQYDCKLFAGQFCFTTEQDTEIRPRTDWCLTVESEK